MNKHDDRTNLTNEFPNECNDLFHALMLLTKISTSIQTERRYAHWHGNCCKGKQGTPKRTRGAQGWGATAHYNRIPSDSRTVALSRNNRFPFGLETVIWDETVIWEF